MITILVLILERSSQNVRDTQCQWRTEGSVLRVISLPFKASYNFLSTDLHVKIVQFNIFVFIAIT